MGVLRDSLFHSPQEFFFSFLELRGFQDGRRGRKTSKSYPWEVRTALWVACPWAGVEACQGAEALALDLIPGEQGAGAPCQEEQEEALASEAFLRTVTTDKGGKLQIEGPV